MKNIARQGRNWKELEEKGLLGPGLGEGNGEKFCLEFFPLNSKIFLKIKHYYCYVFALLFYILLLCLLAMNSGIKLKSSITLPSKEIILDHTV